VVPPASPPGHQLCPGRVPTARHTVMLAASLRGCSARPKPRQGPWDGPRDARPGQAAPNLLPRREPDIYSHIPIAEAAFNARCDLPARDSRGPITASPEPAEQLDGGEPAGTGRRQPVPPQLRSAAAAAEAPTVQARRHNRCLVKSTRGPFRRPGKGELLGAR